MSKKEGEILKFAIKKAKYTVEGFAKEMGYTNRTSLNYWLSKDAIDYEVKEKAAKVLGVTVNELFDIDSNERNVDTEKEALRDLVDAQKQIITYWKEALLAQALRNEYALDQVLQNQARILTLVDPAFRKKDPDEVYTDMKTAVEDKLKKDHGRMMAG